MAFNQTAAAPSHKMRRCLLMAFALIALAITVLPTASFAGTDTAGNVLATDNDANPSGVEGDLYWAGQALNLDDTSIDRDIIAAGIPSQFATAQWAAPSVWRHAPSTLPRPRLMAA